MRMPFGARDQRVWRTVGNAGYRSVFWTLDSADWREGWTAPMVRDRVLSEAGNGFIVVNHSQPPATADAIEEIIVGLRQRGFELVTVTALIGQGGAASFLSTPLEQPPDPNDLMALVNKSTALPQDYVPYGLVDLGSYGIPAVSRGLSIRAVAAQQLKEMLDAARAAGLDIQVLSSYRSYADQQAIHTREVAAVGKVEAERYVAPPGHSQHQLGTTVDLTARSVNWDLSETFADTPEGRWLAANAPAYGFALSYPKGKEAVTGYGYEPWHFRFLGVAAARDLAAKGVTMEEYLSARN
jgi:D-alanyl-D-alanine carboxypeptidase